MKFLKLHSIRKLCFGYEEIASNLYFGFKKEKGFFTATPEKALVDAFYLMSYGRYALDISALDSDKLDRNEIIRLSMEFPLNNFNKLWDQSLKKF
jgi:hypothetical protein